MQQQQHIQAIMKIVVKRESDALPLWAKAITAATPMVLLFLDGVKVCFIFFVFNLFSSAFHQSRSWHLFSNPYYRTLSWLPVGHRAYSLATS